MTKHDLAKQNWIAKNLPYLASPGGSITGNSAPSSAPVLYLLNTTATSQSFVFNAVTGATSYKLYRSISGAGSYTLIDDTITGSGTITCTDSTLSAGVKYDFKLYAHNGGGDSSASNVVTTPYLTYAKFTGTNGTALASYTPDIGSAGVASSGTWQIQSNTLRCTAGGAGNNCYFDVGVADVVLTVDATHVNTTDYGILIFNYVDVNNYWMVFWLNGTLALYQVITGSFTLRDSQSISISNGETVSAVAGVYGDTVFGLVKGISVVYTVSNRANKTVTKHGLRTAAAFGSTNGNVSYDNFSISPITPTGTTGYSYNNSAVMLVGSYTQNRIGNRYYSSTAYPYGFEAQGIYAQLSLYSNAANYYIYVDGVLTTTITAQSGQWITATVPLGSDAYHLVEVRQNAVATIYNETSPIFLKVTGSSPAVRYPTTFANPLTSGFEATSGAYVVDDGTAFDNVSGRQGGWLRFKATTTRVKVCALYPAKVALYEAGVYVNSLTQSVAGNQWMDLGAVTGGSEKEYWLFGDFQISGISAASVNSGALSARDKWQFLGDSITRGYNVSLPWYVWCHDLALRKGVALFNRGLDGSTLVGQASNFATWVTANAPKYVIENYGHNDAPNGSGGLDAFKNAQYDAIVAALGVAGVTKYFKVGMFNFTGNANRSLYNSAAQSICTGGADARGNTLTAGQIAKVTYVDTDGWIDPATNTSDGAHPNDGAGAIIGALAAAAIS